MRCTAVALSMLLWAGSSTVAQVSIGVSLPGVSIGFNMPVYPQFVQVPGYPVYYAPQSQANFFFYDGMYWVYQQDSWYSSTWYNGPWYAAGPEAVPLFVLRIPVRYYRNPPAYFRGWQGDAPPRWGEHWGQQWSQQRSGWDRWDRRAAPAPAPLPTYQRQYSGKRYPPAEQQPALQTRNYRYQPHDAVVRQHYQTQVGPTAATPNPRGQQSAPDRTPDQRGHPAVQNRPEQPPQSQQGRQPQQPHQPEPSQHGADRRQPQGPGADEPGQAQRHARGNSNAKPQEADRGNTDEGGGRH